MSQIRWGLIGCGDVASKRVAAALMEAPDSTLVAACRRDPANLNEFCEDFGISRRYTDAEELLRDGDVDAVYLATPVSVHHPHTLAAAAAGKHVLVEKPMAMDVGQCDEMIAACRDADVRLGVAYYRRFYPMVARMQQLLNDGTIGQPLSISAITATPLQTAPGDEGSWRTVLSAGGGGALMDVGSHRIDIFLNLFGAIEEVKAFCGTVAADYEAEDSAALIFRFRSGTLGTLQCHFGCDDPDEFAIQGTKGRLIARPLNGDQLIVETENERRSERHPPDKNFCLPLVADFVEAVNEQRDPRINGETGRTTNLIMQCAYADAGIAISHPEGQNG